MNNIERLQKLSGIYITEAFGAKKYADHDKAGLLAVKKELQGVLSLAARASFKYKNAQEELKVVESCLKSLEEPEKKEVKEGEELEATEQMLEAAKDDKDDDKEDKKSEKKDDDKPAFLKDKKDDSDDKDEKDSDKDDKDDKKSEKKEDKEDKKSEKKDDDKDDDKPAFLKDKKDDKDSDDKKSDSKKDSDDKDDKEDKSEKKDDDEDDDSDDGEKTVKVEVKVEETVEEIAARILEKETTLKKVETDYENAPVENSGIQQERADKVRVPASVKTAVNQRLKELETAVLRYDDKGYNDKSIKQQAADCLKQIMQDVSTNDMEGLKKAQIYFGTLMSPLTDFFPPQLINWLANASNAYVAHD